MPKITNSTLKTECARLAKLKAWDKGDNWTNEDMAVAVIRTTLQEMGATEQMQDSFAAERRELMRDIKRCFTAPVNFQRDYLVEEGLAPVKAEKPKTEGAAALA